MNFNEVIGQKKLIDHLSKAIDEERISHAQLLVGKNGYGTLALALAYANALLMKLSPNPEAVRTKTEKFVHPDIHFVFPVTTTPRVKSKPVSGHFLDDWRSMLGNTSYFNAIDWMSFLGVEKKQGIINVDQSGEILNALNLKSFEGSYKICIIWEADKMNIPTANKLLKIIEEPPQKTLFLLTAENSESMLQTILSRTQQIMVPPIDSESIKTALIEKYRATPENAASIAKLSDGDFTEAIRMVVDSEESHFNRDRFIQWMRMCYSKKVPETLHWMEEIASLGREKQIDFLNYALHIFRESLIKNYAPAELNRLDDKELAFVSKFAPFIHAGNSLQMVYETERAIQDVGRNANPKILFLDLSLKITKLLTVKPQ